MTNGRYSDLGFRNFRVIDDVPELGTEGPATEWKRHPGRGPRRHVVAAILSAGRPGPAPAKPARQGRNQRRQGLFVVGHSSILVRVTGSATPIVLRYPRDKQLKIPLAGKTAVVFWSKYINPIVHAWQGMRPVVTLYETDQKFAVLRPAGNAIPLTDERTVLALPSRSAESGPRRQTLAPRRRPADHAELDHHRVPVDGRAADAGVVRRPGDQMTTFDNPAFRQ